MTGADAADWAEIVGGAAGSVERRSGWEAGGAAGTSVGFLLSSLIVRLSVYSGPLMPPSLRMRQKWTARKMAAASGMRITCST